MGLLPALLGLIWPACGQDGIGGLPVPAMMDLARIERPSTPNTYLAAPAGFTPAPLESMMCSGFQPISATLRIDMAANFGVLAS